MDTKTQVRLIYSEVAEKAIEIGRKHHMPFFVVGYGEIPTRPFFRGKWWFEPVEEAPEKARKQIAVLKASGITFKGYMIAHEIELVEKKEEQPVFKINSSITPSHKSGSDFLASALKFTLTAGLVMLAMIPMALIDPVIIGVCEADGTWINILTYYK